MAVGKLFVLAVGVVGVGGIGKMTDEGTGAAIARKAKTPGTRARAARLARGSAMVVVIIRGGIPSLQAITYVHAPAVCCRDQL